MISLKSAFLRIAMVGVVAVGLGACDDDPDPTQVLPVLTVEVVPDAATLQPGQTVNLVAVINGATGLTPIFTSSNQNVATVSATGVVTAVAPGTAVIQATVTAADGRTAADASTITVTAPVPPPVTLNLTPETATVARGSSFQFVAIVGGTTNTAVTCTSSNTAVATVTANGTGCLVQAVGAGTAVITARSVANNAVVDVSTIVVTQEQVGITVTPQTITDLGVGQTRQIVANVSGTANQAVTCTTADATIASVTATNNTCVVTGVGPGQTVITVTSQADPTRSAQVAVTVVGASVAIANITGAGVPNAAQGVITIATNVSVPAGTADSLSIRFTNVATGEQFTVRCQTFTSAGAATTVACPFNTIAQRLPNATFNVAAVLFNDNQVAAQAIFGQQITTANVNTVAFNVTFDNGADPNTGVDPLGRTWNGGSVIVTVDPVIFTGQTVATLNIGFDINCDGVAESTKAGTLSNGRFTATFSESAAVGGNTNGVAGVTDLGSCIVVSNARTSTGAAVTLAGTASATFNLDNVSPVFPGDIALPGTVINNFISSGFVFRATGTNALVNANAVDRQGFPLPALPAFNPCPAGATFTAADECVNVVGVQIFAGLTSNFPTTVNQANLAAFAAGGANVTGQTVNNVSLLQSSISNAQFQLVLVARDTLGNQTFVAGPTFGVDLTAPTIAVAAGSAPQNAINPAAEITINVTDDFSGPAFVRARITGHSVLEFDTDAGTEVRCFNNAGTVSPVPAATGVCPTFDLAVAAGAGTTGVATIIIPATESFFVIEIQSVDAAGNVSTTTVTRQALVDAEAPAAAITSTTVAGTSVSIAGNLTDNIDLDFFDLRFLVPGTTGQAATDIPDEIPFVTPTDIDSFGLPLTGVFSASGTTAVAIRALDATAPFTGTDAIAPTRFGFAVFDVAGNTNLGAFAAQSAVFTPGAPPAAEAGVAGLNAFAISENPTTICRTGTAPPCANVANTTTTISAVATTGLAVNANPFQTVFFFFVHPGADLVFDTGNEFNVLIGTASGANSTVSTGVTTRTFTVTQTLAASALPTVGTFPIFAIGVDAQGDAVISEVDMITVQ